MLATERVLGPRWSQKELRTFYILLKAYGKQWERLEERLPSRTNAMIRALYDMHRGYLSLPEASAEGFCTIMTDHYKSLAELQQNELSGGGEEEEEKKAAGGAETSMEADDVEMAVAPPRSPLLPPPASTLPHPPTPVSVWSVLPVDSPAARLATPTTARVKEETPSSDTRSKKKRKLEKFLMRDGSSADDIDSQVNAMKLEGVGSDHDAGEDQRGDVKRRRRSRKALSTDQHAANARLPTSNRLSAPKYRLPWYYWFYSFVDTDFFQHNEFVDCLQRMQLGNLVKVARPIWSSVRASMGNPRRLSQCFLGEEKKKLEHYREVKRRGDTTLSSGWPYRAPVALASGLRVLAHLSHPRRFVFGTIENFSVRDGVCKVRLDNNGSRVCSLDSVMIFPDDHPPLPAHGSAVGATSFADQPTTQSSSIVLLEQAYQDKLAAIALVRDLLKRKELLVNAMTKMNAQARILRHDFTSNNYGPNNTISDETLFQRQYAWLVVNLDVTNRYLRAALLRLQDVSRVPKVARVPAGGSCEASSRSNSILAPSAPSTSSGDAHSSTLTLEHMRWAVNFLTLSRKKTSELVTAMNQVDDSSAATPATPQAQGAEASPQQATTLSPEMEDLIANCLSLATVIRRGSSATIPPLITQKLMERMFELLEPRFESNMDLFAELRSAAEGFSEMQQQLQQPTQAATMGDSLHTIG